MSRAMYNYSRKAKAIVRQFYSDNICQAGLFCYEIDKAKSESEISRIMTKVRMSL